ncbi:hypothetical protein ACFLQ0_01135 [Nitrospinota bacterium]
MFAVLIAVCAGTALLASVLLKADLSSVANFLLFGSTDPYVSPERMKEVEHEMKEMIKKGFEGN